MTTCLPSLCTILGGADLLLNNVGNVVEPNKSAIIVFLPPPFLRRVVVCCVGADDVSVTMMTKTFPEYFADSHFFSQRLSQQFSKRYKPVRAFIYL